jgi:hypothetical protein
MQKLVIALAASAAIGFSGAAFAEEATTGTWTTTTGPAAMTDSEMDGVTAGLTVDPNPQCGTNGQCGTHALGHAVGGPADNGRGSTNPKAATFQ